MYVLCCLCVSLLIRDEPLLLLIVVAARDYYKTQYDWRQINRASSSPTDNLNPRVVNTFYSIWWDKMCQTLSMIRAHART